jgi:flagellar motor switch protein FliN/FliY
MATIDHVSLDIQVVLGCTDMPVHQVLRLGRGAIIELDATEDDEVRILANNFPVARGIVVVQGNRIAVESRNCCRARRTGADPRGAPRCTPETRSSSPLFGPGRFVTSPVASTPFRSAGVHSNAVVAELVDALA